MSLTLADNLALTPELAKQALTKCKNFFIGLTFSWGNGYLDHQKLLHNALKNGSWELTFEAWKHAWDELNTIVFCVKIWESQLLFKPNCSNLGIRCYWELAKILTDDEISSLFLYWVKNRERDYEDDLLSQISEWNLSQGVKIWSHVIHGVTNQEAATNALDDIRQNLAEISQLTAEHVRLLLIVSE